MQIYTKKLLFWPQNGHIWKVPVRKALSYKEMGTLIRKTGRIIPFVSPFSCHFRSMTDLELRNSCTIIKMAVWGEFRTYLVIPRLNFRMFWPFPVVAMTFALLSHSSRFAWRNRIRVRPAPSSWPLHSSIPEFQIDSLIPIYVLKMGEQAENERIRSCYRLYIYSVLTRIS